MSTRPKILTVVGTRPNFMKTAPVLKELGRRERFQSVLVHTGQHYDDAMSQVFFEELGVRPADHFLGVGSGSHSAQVARVLERLEPVLRREAPDLMLVSGDVNSTLAGALTAAQLHVTLGHVEAGLRSFDRTMPEEINRVVADSVSDLLFIHSPEARENLLREGHDAGKIHDVGNTMIDTIVAMRDRIASVGAPARHGVTPGDYLVVTVHRPAMVDGPLLAAALDQLRRLARDIPVVFPAHPRTRRRLQEIAAPTSAPGLRLLPPLGYIEFMGLVAEAAGVVTDSGGIQEETTYLGIPCFTLRDTTERPVTVESGTNALLGLRPEAIRRIPELLAAARARTPARPARWDGHAAERIVDVLEEAIPGVALGEPPTRAPSPLAATAARRAS